MFKQFKERITKKPRVEFRTSDIPIFLLDRSSKSPPPIHIGLCSAIPELCHWAPGLKKVARESCN